MDRGIAATSSNSLSDCYNPNAALLNEVSPAPDSNSVQTRCSVNVIHDIISRFDHTKRRLVQQIGFGGLLKFPPLKSTNRRFSAWLMQLVDIENSSLTLPNGIRLHFNGDDVGIVFGIPASGKDVTEARQVNKKSREKIKLSSWPLTGKDQNSIKAVEELVNTTYDNELTPEQADTFKVAFVIFVMSTLFIPGAKHDYVHTDYWAALSTPSTIQQYNWAAYIHKRLIAAAGKYKTDLAAGNKAPHITGCDLFLQVFYLDNLDIEDCIIDHSVRPRIASFSYDRMQSMIAADTTERTPSRGMPSFGKSKVRPRETSPYTWAQSLSGDNHAATTSSQLTLWESVVRLAAILRIPLESAGPLFLALSNFDKDSDTASAHRGMYYINRLLRIVEPFIKGFKYNFNFDTMCEGQQEIDAIQDQHGHPIPCWHGPGYTIVPSTCNCMHGATSSVTAASSSLQPSNNQCPYRIIPKRARFTATSTTQDTLHAAAPHSVAQLDYSLIESMSRFYMLARYIRQQNQIDLNSDATDTHETPSTTHQPDHHLRDSAKTPWELIHTAQQDTHVKMASLNTSPPPIFTMPRIVDYTPKYIDVLPMASREQLLGVCEMEMDMFDAILRSFRRTDDTTYTGEGRLRWRHYFESDILASIISGWFDIHSPSVRNQFLGQHLAYDIYNCTQLFFPVILHDHWVSFAWNLARNEIVVFDPSCLSMPGFPPSNIYTQVAQSLKGTLSSAIPTLFPGWHHDWNSASLTTFHWRYAGVQCQNRTGVLCAYFCKSFNGKDIVPPLELAQIDTIAHLLFSEAAAVCTTL